MIQSKQSSLAHYHEVFSLIFNTGAKMAHVSLDQCTVEQASSHINRCGVAYETASLFDLHSGLSPNTRVPNSLSISNFSSMSNFEVVLTEFGK